MFSLKSSLIGLLAATGFRFGIGAGLGLAVFSSLFLRGEASLRFFLGLLLHGHNANFFSGLDDVTSCGFHALFVTLGVIGVFGSCQLLLCFGQRGKSVLAAAGIAGDANGVARFKEVTRGLGIDAEYGVFDFGVRGRVDAAAKEFVGSVNVFNFAAARDGNRIFKDHHVSGLRHGEIGFGRNDQSEGLHVGDRLRGRRHFSRRLHRGFRRVPGRKRPRRRK